MAISTGPSAHRPGNKRADRSSNRPHVVSTVVVGEGDGSGHGVSADAQAIDNSKYKKQGGELRYYQEHKRQPAEQENGSHCISDRYPFYYEAPEKPAYRGHSSMCTEHGCRYGGGKAAISYVAELVDDH